jgi:hypothetical protein
MMRCLLSLALAAALVATAGAQTSPESVQKILEKGGKHWSSPPKFVAGETTIEPGQRLLFWPADDEVPDATTKRVTLRFHWLLLPGEKRFERGQALRMTIYAPSDPDFVAMTAVQPAAGEESGMISATLPLEKCDGSGKTELVLFLGLKEPQSNLLQVKVRFEQLATRPKNETR